MSSIFWKRFYNLCIKKGTKPNPVANELGIASGSVTKWKNKNTIPNGDNLAKIADYLDCSVDYLLGRTDNPEINKTAPEEYYPTMTAAIGGASQESKLKKEDFNALQDEFDNPFE